MPSSCIPEPGAVPEAAGVLGQLVLGAQQVCPAVTPVTEVLVGDLQSEGTLCATPAPPALACGSQELSPAEL